MASAGSFPAAIQIAKDLVADPDAMADGKAVLWIFSLALKADDPDLTQRMARLLEKFPGDEETFAAATWLKSVAATLFEDGDIPKASEFLTRALCVAPKHREKLLADTRIAGLLKIERQPSPVPLSKASRRLVRDAEKLRSRRKFAEAMDTLGKINARDAEHIEVIRAAFLTAWHAQAYDSAYGLARHMCRGNLLDRLLAAELYLTYSVTLRQEGRFVEAANVLSEALGELPEFRDTFTKDPRLAGMASSMN